MASGFGVGVGFLFLAAIMFYSPRYFRVSGNLHATLALYGVSTMALMIALVTIGFELSSSNVWHYFTVLVSEGPSSIPWASPSGELWAYAGVAGFFLVGMGVSHVAAQLLGRWRILEVLFKMVTLLFAGLAAVFLASVVDELIFKPLLVVPADRLTSGQTVSDGSGSLWRDALNAVVAVGILISAISGLVAGWAFVFIRIRTILKLLRQ